MTEKETLKKILSIITSDDINKTDAEEHDIAFLAMQIGDEDLALNIINNPKFNRIHINKREYSDETLLTTAAYFGCAKVIKTLLDDKELIEITNTNQSFSPYLALIEPFRSFKTQQYEFPSFSKEILDKARKIESTIPLRLDILDMLLQQEELTLTLNDFLGYIYLRDERYNSKIPFSNSKLFYFSKDGLKKIISNCKCKSTEWLYDDEWRITALGHVAKYCSLEEVELFLKRDDIDINKTFPTTRKSYFSNAATEALGCDSYRGRILSLSNRIDSLYKIVLDKRFSSVLTLDIINRLEYSEIVNKEKIINTILISKDWPKEDIYDETALALAFYHDVINYEILINNENVRLKTNTLEFISKYASKYNYYYGYEFPLKIKEASVIKNVTDLELAKRTDRWTKVDYITYDAIVYKNGLYFDSDKRMGRALEESFLEREQVKKIIKERLGIERYNLSSYVPNRNISVLSYIISENDVVKDKVNYIKRVVEELLDHYHYIEVTDSKIKEEDSRQKKKLYLIN